MSKLRLLSLCTGIGGADLAAEWTEAIEIVGQVEINSFCQAVLAQHWPQVKRMRDIKEVRGHEFGPIDIVAGGIPCQPYSAAGKQRGDEDDRALWPDMFRIVQRCQPTWVVIENVDDFTYMALDRVHADLESQNYTVQAYVLPACAVGAPHIRARCFVVAYSGFHRNARKESTLTQRERNSTEPTSVCEDVAHLSSIGSNSRWTQPEGQPWTPDTDSTGSQEGMADPNGSRGSLSIAGKVATKQVIEWTAWGQPQSRMGRILAGISERLDGHPWPALPGKPQEAWEADRIITGKQRSRNKRLEALGNAIVPYQIFPLFQGIVEWERMAGGQEG